MIGKKLFLQLFLFFISTVAAAQILNPVIPNRILPPTDAFSVPNYPLPQSQTDEIVSPFFRGEYLHNPGLTPPSLHGLYELPIGTQFNFTNNLYNSPQFQPQVNSYYDIYIQSLPMGYAPYHRELMEGQNFKVSGESLSRTRYNSKNMSRRTTRPVQFISSKAAQVRAAEENLARG